MLIFVPSLIAIVTNDQEDTKNTNFNKRNPLKCHLTKSWRNITEAPALYNFNWGEMSLKSSFYLMKNKGRIHLRCQT